VNNHTNSLTKKDHSRRGALGAEIVQSTSFQLGEIEDAKQ
jgi:hypothetical protein